MSELNLVGLHEDGESLVLAGPAGDRYTVRIDDALRAAVRRDRPQLEHLRASSPGTLPVREIQARIRAGASAEEVAADAGIPVEHVRRYDGPVLAEREHVVDRARAARLGDAGAPTLDDLVTDRLASRDVDPADTVWDAARDAAGTWRATARFVAGGAPRTATWAYDSQTRTVHALDDEARWLSESEVTGGTRGADGAGGADSADPAVRSAVRPVLSAVDGLLERGHDPRRPRDAATTDALLDDLGRRRGTRGGGPGGTTDDGGTGGDGALDLDGLEGFEGLGPLRDDPHPAGSRQDRHPAGRGERRAPSDEEQDGTHDDARDGAGPAERPARRGGRRRSGHDRVPVTDRMSVADVVALPFPAPDAGGDEHDHDRDQDDDHDGTNGGDEPADPTGDGPSSPEQRPDADDGRGAAGSGSPETGRRTSSRKQRAKMPSWDEIMFGSRTDA